MGFSALHFEFCTPDHNQKEAPDLFCNENIKKKEKKKVFSMHNKTSGLQLTDLDCNTPEMFIC